MKYFQDNTIGICVQIDSPLSLELRRNLYDIFSDSLQVWLRECLRERLLFELKDTYGDRKIVKYLNKV